MVHEDRSLMSYESFYWTFRTARTQKILAGSGDPSVASPKRACGNRSRLVDFSPAIDRSLLPRLSVLTRPNLRRTQFARRCAEEKECGLASRLRAYGPQRLVLVNVVAEGFWQSCLKHFGSLLRSLGKSLRIPGRSFSHLHPRASSNASGSHERIAPGITRSDSNAIKRAQKQGNLPAWHRYWTYYEAIRK